MRLSFRRLFQKKGIGGRGLEGEEEGKLGIVLNSSEPSGKNKQDRTDPKEKNWLEYRIPRAEGPQEF